MTDLVTGASGFIGSHLVEALVSQRRPVRCLVRDRQRLRWLAGQPVEIVEGDCARRETLTEATYGVDRVFHIAGASWAATATEFYRQNATGTRNLLQACASNAPQLRRFVLVSSQAASGPASGRGTVGENDPPRPVSAYGESKLAAERYAQQYRDRIPITIIRPSTVYGPRDRAFLPYFRLVRRGFLLEFGAGARDVSLCHVSDLVAGLMQAADSQSASGSVYFVADSEPYSWQRVEEMVCGILGVSAKRLILPGWMLYVIGSLGQVFSAVSRVPVQLNRARAAELLERRWVCDTSLARRELGYESRTTLEAGLRQLVRWYEQENWL
jgi:nucleoside-diphosphate-sugar epimerase